MALFAHDATGAELSTWLHAADCLSTGSMERVAETIDGRTIALKDGRLIRLAAIGIPESAPGHSAELPLAHASREALAALVNGRQINLRGPTEQDRYGRYVAEITREDGLWLEGEMLRTGHAWVETSLEHRALAAPMLSLETAARDARLGLWRSRLYAVRDVADVTHTNDAFAIIEGEVAAVSTIRDTTTVSFPVGELQLRLDRAARRRFAAADVSVETLVGSKIRVRGWPYWVGHPVLDLDYPEQIERLDGATPSAVEPATACR